MERRLVVIQPTLKLQCLGFMIGSSFFAVGSSPWLSERMSSETDNLLFFIGAWFFTSAAFVQLVLSGSVRNERGALRALWLAAASQFFGTLLFNVSTGAALRVDTVLAQRHFVWAPDAEGSVAFLISAGFALLVLVRSDSLWGPRNDEWLSTWVNMLGCLAFGVSAVGAAVLPGGGLQNAGVASWGTFIGALCFFVASAVMLPTAMRESPGPSVSSVDERRANR
jgi:hypothetical protein